MAYTITDACIACGACAAGCPVEAITEGDGKFEINPETCIEHRVRRLRRHLPRGRSRPGVISSAKNRPSAGFLRWKDQASGS